MKKITADGVKRQHAYFDAEYKREALRLWRESGRSAAKVASELGIRPALLYRWARPKLSPGIVEAASRRSQQSVSELESEVERLRAENAKLLEQREVLKKSLGILSEPPPRGMPGSQR